MRQLAATLIGAMAATSSLASTAVTAVTDLDLKQYAGTWHEIARLPMYFQRNCDRDVTATYTLNADGTVGVDNRCVAKDGKVLESKGVARRPEPFARGKLQVTFVPGWLRWVPMLWADYWVLALDDDYRWALVGQPGRKYLWILSREPSLDRRTFDDLKSRATTMGYDLGPLIISGHVRDDSTSR
jgi:apolipoprotein D and lipocalin family protein